VDRALVVAAQAGDHEAFEALAVDAADRLFAIARLILRDTDQARDAVQDALIRAWRHLPGLRDPDRFDAWLHRLVANACADQGRRQRRWSAEVMVLLPGQSIDDGARRLEDRDLIERGFRRLNTDQRTVIVLRYYLDQTVPQIARTLGIAEGTVKSRIHNSMAVLRSALEADRGQPMDSVERTA
jgi:RNA polymerase sigma-70 factor (ECF subfamily)